ncbi:MAG: alanine:cation symporter family protein [Bacteroidales bacterium]|nr:alanine:cation symporter family protein [Bacteroidales bacterium]
MVADFITTVGDYIWTYLLIGLLLGCAVYFTIRTRGIQFRMIPEMCRIMLGRDRKDKGGIGSFQAFAVALASRVGTGNLAGVASAIFIGGPGAVFWMWITALFGAATAFMEATLAQLYKKRGREAFYGGPAYYMTTGLGARWMAVFFAVLVLLNFGMANQTVQSNTIVASLSSLFGVNPLWVALSIALLAFAIVSGGVVRISRVTSILVPFMAIGYILVALYVLLTNLGAIPQMLGLIFKGAFGFRQAAGGMFGAAIMQGVKRGLFSNEAGEGSAPNAAAIADTTHPVKQGLIQALGVFVDTILICTCTAIIILLSGLWDSGADGILLTTLAIESEIGAFGKYFLSAAVFLFAFTTIISNYYYAETNLRYLTRWKWPVWTFRVLTLAIVFLGALIELQTAWAMVDFTMALMTLCNLISLLLLSNQAFVLLKDYRRQKKDGRMEPEFDKSILPDIASKLESW